MEDHRGNDDSGSCTSKKNPPSIPSNFVTLHQLQERWIKEQQRKQKEKEEQEPQQQLEARVEGGDVKAESGTQRGKGKPVSRRSGNHRRDSRRKSDTEAEKEPAVAVVQSVTASGRAEGKIESDGLRKKKDRKKSERNKNQKGDQAGTSNDGGEIAGDGHASQPVSAEKKYRNRKKDQARASNDVKVIASDGHASQINKNENEDQGKITGGDTHGPQFGSVQRENVPGRRLQLSRVTPGNRSDFRRSIRNSADDGAIEVEGKFRALSMNGWSRNRGYGYRRQNGNFIRGNWNSDMGFRKFTRHGEQRSKNAGMVWVRKRVSDENAMHIADPPEVAEVGKKKS